MRLIPRVFWRDIFKNRGARPMTCLMILLAQALRYGQLNIAFHILKQNSPFKDVLDCWETQNLDKLTLMTRIFEFLNVKSLVLEVLGRNLRLLSIDRNSQRTASKDVGRLDCEIFPNHSSPAAGSLNTVSAGSRCMKKISRDD